MTLRRCPAAGMIACLVILLAARDVCAQVAPASKPLEPVAAKPDAKPEQAEDDYYELLKLFVDTLDQVERNYVKDLSRRELVEAAIQGMLAKLDEHTNYIGPDDIDRFRTSVESEFPGIGVRLSSERGKLVVSAVLGATPAERAGVVAGDVITRIENEPTENMKLDDAVKRLKGEAGSQVVLHLLRPATNKEDKLTLTRELVRVETVFGVNRSDGRRWNFICDADHQIAYVRLAVFGRHSAEELQKVLTELRAQQMKALVLDLRFNPGGLLTTAVEVADLFVAEGKIVSTSGRNVQEQVWEARQPDTLEDFPMAVLVNQYSASASEIVAACLQDHQRAVVVGQRTLGKGSVQNIVELDGGRSALKLTTAGYFRPSGKNIDRQAAGSDGDNWGVRPNEGLEVVLSGDETRRLAQAQRKGDEESPTSTSSPRLDDKQLEKALQYLREQLAAGPTAASPTAGQPSPK